MSLKSVLGLDGFDLTVHAVITGALIVAIGMMGDAADALIGGSLLLAGSLVLLAIRRSLALRRLRRTDPGFGSGEMAAERIAELENRVSDLEAAQGRMVELEERLDFTERLLAQRRDPQLIEPAGESRPLGAERRLP